MLEFPRVDVERSRDDVRTEVDTYRLLGPHGRLVRMLRHSETGLVLEYMPNGTVEEYLNKHHHHVSMDQRRQWAREAADGLHFLHSHQILHCDVKSRNFLLDLHLSLKIADFSGSCRLGCKAAFSESTRFRLLRD